MTELHEFVEGPKADILLKPAMAMRPAEVSAELQALEAAGEQLAVGHTAASLVVGQLLRKISSGLGAMWTPVSMFLGMVRSAALAHLSQDIVWERIARLREALAAYCKSAHQVVASAEAAVLQAQGYVPNLSDPAWHEASERLRLHAEALGDLEGVGMRIRTELSLLPQLAEEFRRQTISIPAQKAASEIELVRLLDVPRFNAALNRVTSMIRRLE